jgi:hypothetical protein
VALNIDDQSYGYAAAGDGVAKDPISGVVFGFPGGCGGVFDSDATAIVNFLVPGNGIESASASRRKLLTSTGTTIETKAFESCFEDAPASTCSNPDVTQSEPGIADNGTFFSRASPFTAGSFTLGADDQPHFSSNYLVNFFTPQCGGGTNFARDADTGDVSVIRSGYGLSTQSQRVIVMLVSDDPNTLEAGTPATLEIAGHSPVTLLVTDTNGHKVGFIPAVTPTPPAAGQPKIDQPSTIVSEIFGASYSGMNSSPQVILIPFPKPGDYTVLATGTGSGPFTVTMQTLNVNGVVLSGQVSTGTASTGSSSTIGLTIQNDGSVTLKSSCAAEVSNSVTITRSGFSYNFTTRRFYQKITLTNTGASAIADPLSLVLASLSSNATLFNATGTTSCAAPVNSPFINIAGPLGAGASTSVVLQFTDPTHGAIAYSTRVFAGSGSR